MRSQCTVKSFFSFAQQVEEYADEKGFLLWAAFGDHQGHGHEGRVGDDPPALLVDEDAVALEEPGEVRGADVIPTRRRASSYSRGTAGRGAEAGIPIR